MTGSGHESYRHLQVIYQIGLQLSQVLKKGPGLVLSQMFQKSGLSPKVDPQDWKTIISLWQMSKRHRTGFFFLCPFCIIWLCALDLSLSVFTVALGSSLHPQLMEEWRDRQWEMIEPVVLVWSTLYCWLCHGAMLDCVHSIISMPRCYKGDKWIVQNRLVRDPIYSPWICG